MVLEPLAERVRDLSTDVFAGLGQAIAITRTCATEVRTISHLLHPPFLDGMGLPSAVRWYTEGFATRSGIEVQLQVPDDLERLSADIEIALFRLQESLTNEHRHSGSKTAHVTLGADAH